MENENENEKEEETIDVMNVGDDCIVQRALSTLNKRKKQYY